MLVVSEYYQTNKNFAVNNQLTDFVKGGRCGVGVSKNLSRRYEDTVSTPQKEMSSILAE
jgi:hypothetical protein